MSVSEEVNGLKIALKDFVSLSQEIRSQQERYNEMKAGLGTVGGPELSLTPKGPPAPGDKIGAIIVRFEKLGNEIIQKELEYQHIEERLDEIVSRLKRPDEQTVIRMRYIDEKSWREIAVRIYALRNIKVTASNRGSCERTVQSYHGSALAHMVKICEENPRLRFWETPSD